MAGLERLEALVKVLQNFLLLVNVVFLDVIKKNKRAEPRCPHRQDLHDRYLER